MKIENVRDERQWKLASTEYKQKDANDWRGKFIFCGVGS
jgi:hypothetical protein